MIRSIRSVRSLCVILIAMFAVAITAPAAFAQSIDPTDEEYGNGVLGVAAGGDSAGDPADAASAGDDSSSSSASISELPFTGLDVAAIAAIGAGLIGAGFVVRRAAHSADETL